MIKKLLYIVLVASQVMAAYAGDFASAADAKRPRKPIAAEVHKARSNNIYDLFFQALENQDERAALELAGRMPFAGNKPRHETPLMRAVVDGTPAIVEALLKRGEPLNEPASVTGNTCFHELAMSQNPNAIEIAQVLLKHEDKDLKIVQAAYDIAIAYHNVALADILRTALPAHTNIPALSEKEKTFRGDANWRNRNPHQTNEGKSGSAWSSIAKYFFGGMGAAVAVYYAYDKFFKEKTVS